MTLLPVFAFVLSHPSPARSLGRPLLLSPGRESAEKLHALQEISTSVTETEPEFILAVVWCAFAEDIRARLIRDRPGLFINRRSLNRSCARIPAAYRIRFH